MMKIVALLLVGCAVSAQAGLAIPPVAAGIATGIPALPTVPDIGGLLGAKIGASVGGGDSGRIPGPVNQLLDGIVAAVKGLVGGLKPLIAGILSAAIPLVKNVLEGLQINVCKPKSETEKIVHQAKKYIETDLHKQLDIPKLEGLCPPGSEEAEVPALAAVEGVVKEGVEEIGELIEDPIEELSETPAEEAAEEAKEEAAEILGGAAAAVKKPISSGVKIGAKTR